jgi:hypothetical protein
MAIEINSERAVSLIQSATVPHFQSAPWPGVPVVSLFFVKRLHLISNSDLSPRP